MMLFILRQFRSSTDSRYQNISFLNYINKYRFFYRLYAWRIGMLDEILRPGIDHFQWANNPAGYDKIHVLERVKVSQKRNKQSTWKISPLVSSTNLFVLEQLECKHKWTFCSSNICEMKDDYKK